MKANTITIIVAVVILALVGASWYVLGRSAKTEGELLTRTFVSISEDKETISVIFNNEKGTATLTGRGYSNLVFKQEDSASRTRYINEENDLELWSQGHEISLFVDGVPVFVGWSDPIENGVSVVVEDPTDIELPSFPPILENDISNDATDERLSAHVWSWFETRATGGSVVKPAKADAFTLTFEEVGNRVSGTTDCNGFFGHFNLTGERSISFGAMASTLMFCPDSQEAAFSGAVASATSYSFDADGDLVLNGPDGAVVFTKKN